MFEKVQQTMEEGVVDPASSPVAADAATSPSYGLFDSAQVSVEGDTVVITVPLSHGISTVRAHKAVVAAWATDNVAGGLLEEAKNLRP
ncbi:MAG: hypothetical protein AB1733_11880 [Thermodesulfobacteriota bacterium]